RNPHVLLCGTELGCYVSVDDGAAWNRLGGNLPRTAVHDLVVHPRERHVLVATHGRGIWALDGRAFDELDQAALAQELKVLPPSDGVLLPRAYGRGNVGVRSWSVGSPFTAATFRFNLKNDDARKVSVEVLDAAGAVLFKEEVEGKAGYHELAWQARGFGGVGVGGFGGRGGGGARGEGAGARPGGGGGGRARGRAAAGRAAAAAARADRDRVSSRCASRSATRARRCRSGCSTCAVRVRRSAARRASVPRDRRRSARRSSPKRNSRSA